MFFCTRASLAVVGPLTPCLRIKLLWQINGSAFLGGWAPGGQRSNASFKRAGVLHGMAPRWKPYTVLSIMDGFWRVSLRAGANVLFRVSLHSDANRHKADFYCRFVQFVPSSLFYAVKREVHVNRQGRVTVPRNTDQWVQRAYGVRLIALWVCAR